VAKVSIANDAAWPFKALLTRNGLRRSFQGAVCRLLLFVVFFLAASYCVAEEPRPTEAQVEAAYLYNFGKFVTWPGDRPATPDSFGICILGKDPFGGVLDSTVAGESIGGKKIVVHRLSSMQQADPCNILFISSSEQDHLSAVLVSADRLSLLTVSNIENFAERGGEIGLVAQQDRIRFEVNRAAAEHSHLTLSSELLKVAIRVIERNTGK
jgi:YfiR/HmsC-like